MLAIEVLDVAKLLVQLAGDTLVEIVLPAVFSLVGLLIVQWIRARLARERVQLSEDEDRRLQDIVDAAILAIEEKARRIPLSGDTKTAQALDLIVDGVRAARRRGQSLPWVDATIAEQKIHERLPTIRASLTPTVIPLPVATQPRA